MLGAGWNVEDLKAHPELPAAEETGDTFEANAALKALQVSAAVPEALVLSDDSGLEVDALDGRPGVWSARYAGPGASDAANNAKLLEELSGVPAPARSARYRCVIAFVREADDVQPVLAEGSWEGFIAAEPKGSGGFGYDPLFMPLGHQVSAAEMSAAAKNAISHRGLALAALLEQLL